MLLGGFCADTAGAWGAAGYFVLVIKIVIPLVLIILGMIDLGKAVISSKEDEINKAVGKLIRRFIAAVIVFFIPTIVSALFNLLFEMNYNDTTKDINTCMQCLTNIAAHKDICKSELTVDTGTLEPKNDTTEEKTNK